jgi:hypothetical protein
MSARSKSASISTAFTGGERGAVRTSEMPIACAVAAKPSKA